MNTTARYLALTLLLFGSACTRVPAGYVGVKVYMLGGNKGGNDLEILNVGRYWVGWNEELHLFPLFEQNPKYTAGAEDDAGRSVDLQTKEGMVVDADFSVTYTIEPQHVSKVFQKYRLGIDEINKGPLRNLLRDAISDVASRLPVEAVYGEGKMAMVEQAERLVIERAALTGITVTQISLLGAMRLPAPVVAALNSKIEATQRAEQRENELREAEAQAKKTIAQAQGEATASVVTAKGQAEANRIVGASLTPELIEDKRINKWNGQLPMVTSAANLTLGMQSLTK